MLQLVDHILVLVQVDVGPHLRVFLDVLQEFGVVTVLAILSLLGVLETSLFLHMDVFVANFFLVKTL